MRTCSSHDRRRTSAACIGLALLAFAPSCSSGTDDPGSTAATARETTTPTATTHQAAAERVAGDFRISNTTEGRDAAVVETLVVRIESAPTGDGPWANTGASCTTTPLTPIRIETSQRIAYDCRLDADPPAERRLRLVVRASIAGSDELFQIVSDLPR
jgi:hypothetical protein